MNRYELGVVIKPDLEEEVFRAELEKVTGLVTRFGGVIEKVDEWGRRKLAYPIDKITDGVYTFITFNSPADAPSEIENRIRIMENVMRFLLVKLDE
ncbi:MAG: 30S ribosomal protein S6 [Defluviitaleaceae bacterium]|nr:30S ribosomal protein S6 [Defluviitaleaceae bacterium]